MDEAIGILSTPDRNSQNNEPAMGNIVMQKGAANTNEAYIVLFGNLPWKARWQDLKDLVRYYSNNIERAEVYLLPDGRSRGFGFVRIRGREDAMRVVENLDGFEWDARALMVKLGNDQYMCPILGHPTVDPPQHPEAQNPGAGGHPHGLSFVMEPGLPPECFGPAAVGASAPHDISYSGMPLYREHIAMQAFLHYKARSTNYEQQLEYHRREAEVVCALRGGYCPWVVEHQYAEHMHNEHRARAQNQASVAYQLSNGHINVQRHQVIHGGQAPAFPSLLHPAYEPPPGILMPASGFGHVPPAPGYGQFMVEIDPSQSMIDPAPIFVTPENGLPVNLANGALVTQSRGVFVGNLPYNIEGKDLESLLKSAGKLEKCDVPTAGGKGRGYGTAVFTTAEEAQRACCMFDQQWFKGRQIKVRLDKYTMRKHSDTTSVDPPSSGPLVVVSEPAH